MYTTKTTKEQIGKNTKQTIISIERHETVEEAATSFLEKIASMKIDIKEGQIQTGSVELYNEGLQCYLSKNMGNVHNR